MSPSFLAVLLAVLLLSGCAAPAPAPPDAPEPPPEQTSLPAAPPLPEPAPEPEPPPEPEPGDFVRVTDYLPEIRVDLRYAGEDNFTGQVIYSFSGAYLRYGTLEKLSAAQETLAEAGYGLLLWDAFRPTAAQFFLWVVCLDPVSVANPQLGFSSHC